MFELYEGDVHLVGSSFLSTVSRLNNSSRVIGLNYNVYYHGDNLIQDLILLHPISYISKELNCDKKDHKLYIAQN